MRTPITHCVFAATLLIAPSLYAEDSPIDKDLAPLLGAWKTTRESKDKEGTITQTEITLTFLQEKEKLVGIITAQTQFKDGVKVVGGAGRGRGGPNTIAKFEERNGKRYIVLEQAKKQSSIEYKLVGEKLILTGKSAPIRGVLEVDLSAEYQKVPEEKKP